MPITNVPRFDVGTSPEMRVLKVGRSRQPAEDGGDWQRTEATRYLCASAYLHRPFREWVLKHYQEHKHIALAVSYGIDPVAILKHCLIGRRIERQRDLLLFIPFFILVLGGIYSLLAQPEGLDGVLFLVVVLAFLSAFAILAWEQWKINFTVVRRKFTKKNFDPSTASVHFDDAEERLFRDVEIAQNANVIIHAAFSPFVGCGNDIGSWSIPIDLSKGKEDVVGYLRPRSFEIEELYDEIYRSLKSLQLPNCSIEDKLCISGLDIRGERDFLPDLMGRPITAISTESMAQHMAQPTRQSRHYQNFRLVDWSGELVLSAFLRAARSGPNLFLEVSYWLLVPVDESYRRVDNMNPVPTTKDWMTLFGQCLAMASLVWLVWPFRILSMIFHPLAERSRQKEARHMVRENPAYNHGSVTSLREATCTSNLYRRYFQKLDKEMYLKTMENQILACVVKFLDDHNIDTSDLKQAQTKIVNSGIIVAGGSLEANTLAVGRGSSAIGNNSHGIGSVRFMSGLTGRKE